MAMDVGALSPLMLVCIYCKLIIIHQSVHCNPSCHLANALVEFEKEIK